MSPLLGPILAQLVTLGVADRTEARYVISDATYGKYTEVSTIPRVGLNFGWKHTTLTLGYSPSITVTPLEAKDPTVLVFHTGVIATSYRLQRTTFTLSETVGYGKVDFRVQALGFPGTTPLPNATPTPTGGTGTPTPTPTGGGTTGTPTTTGAQPQSAPNGLTALPASGAVRYASSTTTLNAAQLMSAALTLSGGLYYTVSGQVGPKQDDTYPTVRGPGAIVSARYLVTHHDALTTSVSTQFASSSGGGNVDSNNTWVLLANEGWAHLFDPRTTSSVTAGLSITRNSLHDGTIYYSIYPQFALSIMHVELLGRNTLTLGANVSSAPYIDPVRALADPGLGAGAFIGFIRDRFTSSLMGSSAVSLANHGGNTGFNTINGSFNVGYRVGAALSLDSGIRAAWQTFGSDTKIPPSVAAYAGITVGSLIQLSGGR